MWTRGTHLEFSSFQAGLQHMNHVMHNVYILITLNNRCEHAMLPVIVLYPV